MSVSWLLIEWVVVVVAGFWVLLHGVEVVLVGVLVCYCGVVLGVLWVGLLCWFLGGCWVVVLFEDG